MTPGGATRVAAVIGDPVAHSLSPLLHNAAYHALGLDWVYVALPVAAGDGQAAVRAVTTLGLAGLSVTMPHKQAAAEAVDRLTDTAARLGSVNTVVPARDGLLGDSTDGAGFLDDLHRCGFDIGGRRVVVLGAGGAASAVVLAAAAAGAASVGVIARRGDTAQAAAALAGPVGAAVRREAVHDADLVVDATSTGMQAGAGTPFSLDAGWFHPGQLVVDLVYAPAVTPLLVAADVAGADTRNGLGMLVHQAARQVAAFTGLQAPVEVMLEAAARR